MVPSSADQPEQREDKLDDSGFEALATCPAQAECSSQYLYRALADHQLHEYQQQQQLFLLLFLLLLFLYSAYGRVYAAHHTEHHPPKACGSQAVVRSPERPASAAFSFPEPDFLLAANVPSCVT